MVTKKFLVSNFQRAISMVIPRSRSALSLSKTQAYLKEPLPILGFLLELLDSSLVDSSAFVDQMAGGGGLAGVDVTDNDDVDMSLVFATWCHGEQELLLSVRQSKSDSKMG